MNPVDIHKKKLIAVAGKDVFGKSFINVVNKEILKENLMMIGININEEDFGFFINNLKDSKVEVTIFMPEFQKKAAAFYNLDDFLIMAYKDGREFKFITSKNESLIDDLKLLELSKKIRK